ncbi:hypothetical protein [Sphingobium sp. CFD-1]|uniref:hypothetical protein n=1 Tax=Sphingobium sp. CFD-1 TaxID=2878545 RepID=UPI00214C498C|nr:hypothetical protein [Sphingobium sp. CFD-1]
MSIVNTQSNSRAVLYSEAAYFDNAAFQHIADREECQRLERKRDAARKAVIDAERRVNALRKQPDRLPRSQMDVAVDGFSAILNLPRLRRAAKEIGA